MYDELVKALLFIAKQQCRVEGEQTKICAQAADAIEELQGRAKVLEKVADKWCEAVPKWIPVTERLPDETVTVIVTDGVNVGFSFCVRDYGDLEFYSPWKITHWMPLPEPPKEE